VSYCVVLCLEVGGLDLGTLGTIVAYAFATGDEAILAKESALGGDSCGQQHDEEELLVHFLEKERLGGNKDNLENVG
jgi:hypothetical protein